MSEVLLDLLFWIVIFVVFIYGFKWLQRRRQNTKQDETDKDV